MSRHPTTGDVMLDPKWLHALSHTLKRPANLIPGIALAALLLAVILASIFKPQPASVEPLRAWLSKDGLEIVISAWIVAPFTAWIVNVIHQTDVAISWSALVSSLHQDARRLEERDLSFHAMLGMQLALHASGEAIDEIRRILKVRDIIPADPETGLYTDGGSRRDAVNQPRGAGLNAGDLPGLLERHVDLIEGVIRQMDSSLLFIISIFPTRHTQGLSEIRRELIRYSDALLALAEFARRPSVETAHNNCKTAYLNYGLVFGGLVQMTEGLNGSQLRLLTPADVSSSYGWAIKQQSYIGSAVDFILASALQRDT